jgi:Rrf2 family protein
VILSRTGEYALRAILHLADSGSDAPVRVDDIATALSVPRNYLSKILHELGRAGVLTSSRGPRGGFQLALPADELSLSDVVGRFDPLDQGPGCLLGRAGGCSEDDPCAAHSRWRDISGRMQSFFRETTVADLLEHPSPENGG